MPIDPIPARAGRVHKVQRPPQRNELAQRLIQRAHAATDYVPMAHLTIRAGLGQCNVDRVFVSVHTNNRVLDLLMACLL